MTFMQKNTILYIHGFNGDGIGPRVDALRAAFPDCELSVRDYPADPEEVVEIIKKTIQAINSPLFLVAPSLGGFYAWYFSAMYDLPCFLFNPSLRPFETLDDRGVGDFQTWTKKRTYIFKKEYLEKLRLLHDEATSKVKPKNLHFFIAHDDEMLNHDQVPVLYPDAAAIHWYDQQGHRMQNYGETLPLMKRYMEDYDPNYIST